MRLITLNDGTQTKVDDVDFVYLCGFMWTKNSNGYAIRRIDRFPIYMHVEVAQRNDVVGNRIDHVDRDKSNNQRVNLRAATRAQNGANQRLLARNTSGHRGVYLHNQTGKWVASLTVEQVKIHLGCFVSHQDACDAYDQAAERYFGEFKGASC